MSISDRLDEMIEQSARVIGSVMSRWDMDGRPDVDGGIDTLIARTLADAGLLAPSPLREEWGVDCYLGFEPEAYLERRNAEKHLAYEGGSLLRRYVTGWEKA